VVFIGGCSSLYANVPPLCLVAELGAEYFLPPKTNLEKINELFKKNQQLSKAAVM